MGHNVKSMSTIWGVVRPPQPNLYYSLLNLLYSIINPHWLASIAWLINKCCTQSCRMVCPCILWTLILWMLVYRDTSLKEQSTPRVKTQVNASHNFNIRSTSIKSRSNSRSYSRQSIAVNVRWRWRVVAGVQQCPYRSVCPYN